MDTDNREMVVDALHGALLNGGCICTFAEAKYYVNVVLEASQLSGVVGERELLTEVRAAIDYACTAIQRCKEHLGRARLERTLIRIDAALSDKTGGQS